MKYYAGIGSRKTPKDIMEMETRIAAKLSSLGWILRSGAADGSDTAFEQGSLLKEIYLPWKGFNDNKSDLYLGSLENLEEIENIARMNHPNPNLSGVSLKLMMRNVCQILGRDLKTPSSFVLCWTEDGCTSYGERTTKTGGTGQAIAIASKRGIPVFNLANRETFLRLNKFLESEDVRF